MELLHLRISEEDLQAVRLIAAIDNVTVQFAIRRIIHEAVKVHRDSLQKMLREIAESEKHHAPRT